MQCLEQAACSSAAAKRAAVARVESVRALVALAASTAKSAAARSSPRLRRHCRLPKAIALRHPHSERRRTCRNPRPFLQANDNANTPTQIARSSDVQAQAMKDWAGSPADSSPSATQERAGLRLAQAAHLRGGNRSYCKSACAADWRSRNGDNDQRLAASEQTLLHSQALRSHQRVHAQSDRFQ